MKVKQVLVLTAMALASGGAFADEARPPSRAEVVQSVLQARAAGTLLPAGEGTPGYPHAVAAPSSVTRDQVQAEVRQARASGTLFAAGEGNPGYPKAGADVSTLTRSEIIAELHLYRESGWAHLNRGPAPDVTAPAYARAQARYAELRASPYYEVLVQRIADRRGEAVTLSKR